MMRSLSSICGAYALPSTARPWSSDELATLLTRIDEQTLAPELRETYRWLRAEAAGVKKPYQFSLSSLLRGTIIPMQTISPKKSCGSVGTMSATGLGCLLGDPSHRSFYSWASISIAGAKFSGYSEDQGPLTGLYGEQNLTTNIFFATSPTGYRYWTSTFRTASSAPSGRGWSAEIGYDRLSWGPDSVGTSCSMTM